MVFDARTELRLRCADIVAQDRRETGRDEGRAGIMRAETIAATHALVASLRHINAVLDRLFR